MGAEPLLILVPARGGSKRLPGKNLKLLGGRSLIARTADAVAESGLCAPVLLTTDDDAVAEEGRRVGMLVPFQRPAALSGDAAPTADAVLHALDWFHAERGTDPDAVLVLQPTSPLRGGRILQAAVDLLAARPDADSIVAVTAMHLPADKLFLADARGFAEPLGRDACRPVYAPNGALYLTRTAPLRAEGTLYAGRVLPLVLDPVRAIDIDTVATWHLAEAALAAGLPPEEAPFAAPPSTRGGAV